jgi:hypothetical protein
MTRLPTLLLAAALALGSAACEAPGGADAPGGGNNAPDLEEGTDTQLDVGEDEAGPTEDHGEGHEEEDADDGA